MVKKVVSMFFSITLAFSLVACGMEGLPEGDLIDEISSDSGKYTINIYLCSGNATTDFSIRGELEDTESNEKRNIYWEYHCEEAEVEWIDDVTVVINGHELNVLEDTYDWRDE